MQPEASRTVVMRDDRPAQLFVKRKQGVGPRNGQRDIGGFSLIEMLVVLGIAGILLGLFVYLGRGTLENQQQQAAIRSVQQSIWQGSSAASARGRNTELSLVGRRIEVREVGTGRVIRTEELPAGVTTNLPTLVFTPPGKISAASFALVENGIRVTSSAGTTMLRVSIIGEVLAETE